MSFFTPFIHLYTFSLIPWDHILRFNLMLPAAFTAVISCMYTCCLSPPQPRSVQWLQYSWSHDHLGTPKSRTTCGLNFRKNVCPIILILNTFCSVWYTPFSFIIYYFFTSPHCEKNCLSQIWTKRQIFVRLSRICCVSISKIFDFRITPHFTVQCVHLFRRNIVAYTVHYLYMVTTPKQYF